MNKHIKKSEKLLSRRQVMIGATGLSFAIALPDRLKAAVLSGERTGTAMPTGRGCGSCRRRRSTTSTAIRASAA